MTKKQVVPFSRKSLISIVIGLSFLTLISLFQITTMWLTDVTYSFFIMPHFGLDSNILKILSSLTIAINIFFFVFFIYKSVIWFQRKLVMRNPLIIWPIIISMILLNILIPNVIPVNFITIIGILFCGVIISTIL